MISLAVTAGVLGLAPPVAAAEDRQLCHHPTWGGTYYCKYNHEIQGLPDGTSYFIVVNINYQVWARWRNKYDQLSQWTGLGGQVWHGDPALGIPDGTPDDLRSRTCEGGQMVIRVRGTNGDWYWKMRYTSGQWTPNWINYATGIPGC